MREDSGEKTDEVEKGAMRENREDTEKEPRKARKDINACQGVQKRARSAQLKTDGKQSRKFARKKTKGTRRDRACSFWKRVVTKPWRVEHGVLLRSLCVLCLVGFDRESPRS